MTRQEPSSRPDQEDADRASDASSSDDELGDLLRASPSSSTLADSTRSAHRDRLVDAGSEHVRAPLPYRDHTRYEFIAEHGRGGLGRVYRARDLELSREVALKELLRPSGSAEGRFLREVLVTARLEHPGIVPVHEAGRWPNGTPYYAMKLVAGRPLSDLLKNARTLDERLALLPHLIAVADAMAYAHDRKVIHRDLKPANIIVGDYGETVVIDWGLAKELDDSTEEEVETGPYRTDGAADLTVAGTVLGTPAYMSPEQSRGEPVDTRTDVYALGAILFQLCTGAATRSDATADDRSRELRGAPEDLAAIALKALEASPDDRYPSALALAADLRAYDTGARITARKYSPLAVIGHWLRHHKGIALSVAIPLAVILAIGVLSLREIVEERDRATTSQRHAEEARRMAEDARRMAEGDRAAAERERDRSNRSEIGMLLEKDPTEARRLLGSQRALTPDQALLMARVRGRPTADHVLLFLPFKIWDALPDENLQTIAITTSDSKIRSIDVVTGKVDVVADQVLKPPLVGFQDGGLIFGRHGPSGPELVQASKPSEPIPFGGLRHPVAQTIATAPDGAYLLGRGRDLLFLPRGQREFQVVGRRAGGVLLQGREVLACVDQNLVLVSGGRIVRSMGRCLNQSRSDAFAVSRAGYAAQSTPSDVVISRGGKRELVAAQEPNQLAMSDAGLVAGIDGNNRAWYIPADGVEKRYGPSSDATLTALGADGRLGAWGDIDGIAHIRDTKSGATWTLVGHSGPIIWIFVSERLRKVVTVGWSEVRVWRIPTLAVGPIVRLPCNAFMMASAADRSRHAITCGDGTVALLERRPGVGFAVRTLHKHDGLALAVTWRGNEVCSGGRDGRVLCTDAARGAVQLIDQKDHPVQFVHSAGSVLAYTVEDGSVWRHLSGEAHPKLLYHHEAEPYRVAVSPIGNIASGANDGSVMAFDARTERTYRATSHTAGIHQVLWRGDDVITSSHDGTVRVWAPGLVPRQIHAGSGPFRDLELLGSTWIANAGGTRLWLHREAGDISIDTGPTITDLAVSPNRRLAGAVVSGDLIVYDVADQAVASIRLGDDGALHFIDDETVLIYGSTTGEIISLSTSELSFVKLESEDSAP